MTMMARLVKWFRWWFGRSAEIGPRPGKAKPASAQRREHNRVGRPITAVANRPNRHETPSFTVLYTLGR
jgi:hypothetical protein